jgi:hypothetical protein
MVKQVQCGGMVREEEGALTSKPVINTLMGSSELSLSEATEPMVSG